MGERSDAILAAVHEAWRPMREAVTDEEAREHAGYFDGLSSHYTEHLPELDGLG